jgi:RNA polymerase sigma-70 factor (ECF subfamily)
VQQTSPKGDLARFESLFSAHRHQVLAYALRRTAIAADAEDVTAETFTIAWRRLTEVPPEPLPWLYGVARRILANQRRSSGRRLALFERLRPDPDVPTPIVLGEDADTPAMVALRRLRPDDQEILRLLAWEGLGNNEIAVVLGVTANAVAIRLHRARQRFAALIEQIGDGHGVKESAESRTHGSVKGTAGSGIERSQ